MSKGNYDEMVFKRGSHAVSRELRLLVPYGGFMRDDTWVDWKRATGRGEVGCRRGAQGRAVIWRAGLIRNSTEERSGMVRYDVIWKREDFCPVRPCFNQPVRLKRLG